MMGMERSASGKRCQYARRGRGNGSVLAFSFACLIDNATAPWGAYFLIRSCMLVVCVVVSSLLSCLLGSLASSLSFVPLLQRCESKDNFTLTPDWRWNMDNWQCMIDSSTDVDGWSYAIEQSRQFHSKKSMEHFVRRRLWQREKIQKPTHLGEGGGRGESGPRKSYNLFLERLELFKQDLKNEEGNDDFVSMESATW